MSLLAILGLPFLLSQSCTLELATRPLSTVHARTISLHCHSLYFLQSLFLSLHLLPQRLRILFALSLLKHPIPDFELRARVKPGWDAHNKNQFTNTLELHFMCKAEFTENAVHYRFL